MADSDHSPSVPYTVATIEAPGYPVGPKRAEYDERPRVLYLHAPQPHAQPSDADIPGNIMWPLLFVINMANAWTKTADATQWYVVNDTVMGGVSASRVRAHKTDGLVFEGNLSLKNNGGFASTRTEDIPSDWSRVSALQMKVVGDGRSYIATVRTPSRELRRIYYRQLFDTQKGEEITVTLPLDDFAAYTFGRRVPGAPSLADVRTRIGSIGVMLADKKEGSFSLHISEISTVESEEISTLPNRKPSAASALLLAIEQGVPLFNQGDADRCADIYSTAIATLLLASPDQLTDGQQRTFTQALQSAQRTDDEAERAWILRRAIDAVLTEMN